MADGHPRVPAVMLRGTWKLHQGRKGPPERYDLAADPGQRTDVAARQPAVVRELSAALGRWTATLRKSYAGTEKDTED